jgi:hypothetical protein
MARNLFSSHFRFVNHPSDILLDNKAAYTAIKDSGLYK